MSDPLAILRWTGHRVCERKRAFYPGSLRLVLVQDCCTTGYKGGQKKDKKLRWIWGARRLEIDFKPPSASFILTTCCKLARKTRGCVSLTSTD